MGTLLLITISKLYLSPYKKVTYKPMSHTKHFFCRLITRQRLPPCPTESTHHGNPGHIQSKMPSLKAKEKQTRKIAFPTWSRHVAWSFFVVALIHERSLAVWCSYIVAPNETWCVLFLNTKSRIVHPLKNGKTCDYVFQKIIIINTSVRH